MRGPAGRRAADGRPLFTEWRAERPFDFRQVVARLFQQAQFVFVPFEADDALLYDDLAMIPEGRDRLIAVVSRKMDAPLITVDAALARSGAVQLVE